MLSKFTWHFFFTKYIAIFKTWMGKWRMSLANLEQIEKKNVEQIGSYKKSKEVK